MAKLTPQDLIDVWPHNDLLEYPDVAADDDFISYNNKVKLDNYNSILFKFVCAEMADDISDLERLNRIIRATADLATVQSRLISKCLKTS